MKHKAKREDYSIDERPVKGSGTALLCPFCNPPHPLLPGGNECGAVLRVTAVRIVIPARVVREKNHKCLKCGQGLGEMVHIGQNSYIHSVNCQPGTHIIMTPQKYSRWAEHVAKLPTALREVVEKRTGKASAMKEIEPDGTETGKILGYFFYKDGYHGKTSGATARKPVSP